MLTRSLSQADAESSPRNTKSVAKVTILLPLFCYQMAFPVRQWDDVSDRLLLALLRERVVARLDLFCW